MVSDIREQRSSHRIVQSASVSGRDSTNQQIYAQALLPPSLPNTFSHSKLRQVTLQIMPAYRQRDNRRVSSNDKIKRVPVTSCDSCRARKLKCNARNLSKGEACSQCCKLDIDCTFDDRDDARVASKTRTPSLQSPTVTGRTSGQRHRKSPPHRDSGVELDLGEVSSAISPHFQSYGGTHHDIQHRGPAQTTMSAHNRETNWGHEQAGLVLASINTSQKYEAPNRVWDHWNVPSCLTDPKRNITSEVPSQFVIESLIHRFYAQPSFNRIIVPSCEKMLRAVRSDDPSPSSSYLLHTIIACAVASSLTIEPELILWRSQVWHGATESVHNRLNRTGPPELELVQALLILSSNWSGSLLRIERINTFDTAINLANSLQLHSGRHLDVIPGPRSSRIVLFWALFCSDKFMSVMTKRSPAITSESHSVPLPSIEDIEMACDLTPKTAIAAWLQRLTFAYITLSQITENVQRQLLLPIRLRQITSLDEVFHHMLPIENRLENFCKEQRWLLGTVSDLSPLCRALAEAVISQLHFTQLHLYLPALQFEVDQRGTHPVQPFRFTTQNDKPLAATIESAWHLVQQPIDGASIDQLPFACAATPTTTSASPLSFQDRNLSFSHACVLIGMNFFRFLATNWLDWDSGKGCIKYTPLQLSPQQPSNQSFPTQTSQEQGDASGQKCRSGSEEEQSTEIGQSQMNEYTTDKAADSLMNRRRLSPLRINRLRSNVEIDKTKSNLDEGAQMDSLAANAHARVMFEKQQRSVNERYDNREEEVEEVGLPNTLHSHAMLTPIRPAYWNEIQGRGCNTTRSGQVSSLNEMSAMY